MAVQTFVAAAASPPKRSQKPVVQSVRAQHGCPVATDPAVLLQGVVVVVASTRAARPEGISHGGAWCVGSLRLCCPAGA